MQVNRTIRKIPQSQAGCEADNFVIRPRRTQRNGQGGGHVQDDQEPQIGNGLLPARTRVLDWGVDPLPGRRVRFPSLCSCRRRTSIEDGASDARARRNGSHDVRSAGVRAASTLAGFDGHSPRNARPVQRPRATLDLAGFERIALERNPTLRQAAAQYDGALSRSFQAGLYPNPVLGYVQEQIGALGESTPTGAGVVARGRPSPGELVGGFVQQEIITGGKLRLSRAKFAEEANAAQW